ncbi:hypothetical protein F0L68_26300 [Solihabitans fulvus]|uniref:Uncharacterized protein n=1 Tax=Solihabitans fulvus TaxID=1892852 RepID=A0A5B2WZT3_9PSEU|nr:hypothetical protein [Solihabitans fulvus]KAA2256548.1 hypothetical protein F0L68_26300 [Solihabitans fulvus]
MTDKPSDQGLTEELRLLLTAVADRAQPWLQRVATAAEPSESGESGQHDARTCGWCPLCAGMALLRGERPELAAKAAEHAVGLLTVLRAALREPAREPRSPQADGAPAEEPATAAQQDSPRVQRIEVRRRAETPGDRETGC